MSDTPPPTLTVQIYRALELLGDTVSAQRSILGGFSQSSAKAWGLAEQEQVIPLAKLVKLDATGQKYEPAVPLHPDLWDQLKTQFPKLSTGDALDARKDVVNTNILPKIGVVLNESILALGMAYGTRIDADGNYSDKNAAMSNDLMIGTMIVKAAGMPMKSAQLELGQTKIVTDEVIERRFGAGVLKEMKGLQTALAAFDDAMKSRQPRAVSIDPHYLNSLAAIKSAELKEAIRIKGYREFEMIDAYPHVNEKDHAMMKKELGAKLWALGLDKDLAVAQDELLGMKLKEMQAVMGLGEVHPAIAAPINEVQVPVVQKVVNHEMAAERMVGYEGENGDLNGQALAMFHRKMPIMNYHVPGHEDHTATLVKALMEASRYHHNAYRKGNNSIIGHLAQTASMGSRDLNATLRPIVATTLVMHDLAEDGGTDVAALDHSLKKISDRFSPLIAELVADLTDAADKKSSHAQGAQKAKLTRQLETFVFADSDARWTNPQKPLTATNPERPYALTNAGPKIADRRATMLEMLNDPDCMSGYSANSGWRIGWRMNSKGFVDDVVQHIVDQVGKYDALNNKDEFHIPTVKDPVIRQKLIDGLRASLEHEFKVDDLFTAQNLTILADEFGLNNEERKKLIRDFADPDIDNGQFKETLDELLKPERIQQQIDAKKTAGLDYSVMYKRSEKKGEPAVFTDETILKYRDSYKHRLEMRVQIHSVPLDLVEGVEAKNMLKHYDVSNGNPPRYADGIEGHSARNGRHTINHDGAAANSIA